MNPKNGNSKGRETVSVKPDFLKWTLVFALLIVGVVANGYYSGVAPAIRIAVGIVWVIAVVAIALRTSKGEEALVFIKAARAELRKVVWPTRQETIQTGMVVVGAVCITALLLWGLDSLFIGLISWLAGQ